MSANHSRCRYAIRGDRVPVAGTGYTTYNYYRPNVKQINSLKNVSGERVLT